MWMCVIFSGWWVLWREWKQPKLLYEPDERPNGNGGFWKPSGGSLRPGMDGWGLLGSVPGSGAGKRISEMWRCSGDEGAQVMKMLITSGFSGREDLFLLPGPDGPLPGKELT